VDPVITFNGNNSIIGEERDRREQTAFEREESICVILVMY
jgi:hypothetical protein